MLGRHERIGLGDFDAARSWNSSYYTRGCSLDLQLTTGGAGLSCCFAAR